MIHNGKRGHGKIIFVTGTDTGVGKTLLATLLLYHLREQGCHALGMKPFACASRADTRLLQEAQDCELTVEEISPFYFPRPVAPLIAAEKLKRKISKDEVLTRIRRLKNRVEYLIIEGCGGLLVPLGKNYTVADLIAALNCSAVVVGRNKLGTINHTLLTANALNEIGKRDFKVVLMNQRRSDVSSETNRQTLEKLLRRPVIEFPFLRGNTGVSVTLRNSHEKVKKILARILE